MVFGNKGETSGTGVAFSRNPATGEKKVYGEYLINAQGEDIVAGIRTPQTIDQLKEQMPEVYDQLMKIVSTLEIHYKDMQDMEFTIEDGKLFFLQTRNGNMIGYKAYHIFTRNQKITGFLYGQKNIPFLKQKGPEKFHGDMIDLNRENIKDFDVRGFYVALVNKLKEKGY